MGETVPEPVQQRLDEHEEVHQRFDRRITKNENYRLQIQGALKFASVALGVGLATLGVSVQLGVV